MNSRSNSGERTRLACRVPCPYAFRGPSAVAQSCTLPYRRFAIGGASASSGALEPVEPQRNAIPRYGRLQICAPLNRYPRARGTQKRVLMFPDSVVVERLLPTGEGAGRDTQGRVCSP